jgi:hypothetical protein
MIGSARLTLDRVKACSGYEFMPFLYVIEYYSYMCLHVCDENLHFNEWDYEFNKISSFTYFVNVCQFLSRLCTNFKDSLALV